MAGWGWGLLKKGLTNHSPPALYLFILVEIAHEHQFHSLSQDHSTMAQRAEAIVDENFLTSYMSAYFPDRFPHYHYAWTA